MVRQLTCCIPNEKYELILSVLQSRDFVHRLKGWHIDNAQSMIQFKIVEKKTSLILDLLSRYGVGVNEEEGTIDIFALTSTKPRVNTQRGKKKKKAYAVHDRLSYEEIYDMVDGQLHLTFDYLALIVVGAIIAGVGLLADSSVSVVASMLVSPLMGPIVGMTFGAIIWDKKMFLKSLRNETLGVMVCWFTGVVIGLCVSPFIDEEDDAAMRAGTEMSSRGTAQGLLPGLFIAIPSGCGVALGITGDQINPLVGVAISAALLPPIVNSGVAIALGVMIHLNDEYDDHVYKEHLTVGMWSACLFLMNWVVIFIFGYIMFKVKRLDHNKSAAKREEKLGRWLNYNKGIMADDHVGPLGPGRLRKKSDDVTTRSGIFSVKDAAFKDKNSKLLSKPLLSGSLKRSKDLAPSETELSETRKTNYTPPQTGEGMPEMSKKQSVIRARSLDHRKLDVPLADASGFAWREHSPGGSTAFTTTTGTTMTSTS